MGALIKPSYTIPLPQNAIVVNDKVQWTVKGEVKTGKLSSKGKVLCRSETWIAKFTDENGNVKRVSTKTKDKAAANRILVKLENEVNQIRAGAISRNDIDVYNAAKEPLEEHLNNFFIYQKAKGVGARQLRDQRSMLERMFWEAKIESLQNITRSNLDKWVLLARGMNRGARTINSYFDRLRTFCNWCVEEKRLHEDPTAKIKDQNEDVDKRKQRRSLSNEEIENLLQAARDRPRQKNSKSKGDEIELAYRVMLGTGLRSTELASLVVYQIDTQRLRIDLRPIDTKNKKGGFQPIKPELADRIKKRVAGMSPTDKIFNHNADSLGSSFRRDCKAAGIERHSPDGRSIDVHSLRKTFGTMLARAGVPLTTTQKLMRHSTPELTAKLYIDVEPIDMTTAIDKLPDF